MCFNRQKKTHHRDGLFGVFRMIGITNDGQLIEITNLSSLTGVKLVGVLVTDSHDLNPAYLNISNHFYRKDSQQLCNLALHALRTNQSPLQQMSEQL